MLMIRLARIGKKKQPYYRLVVSEKARDMYGKALEILGNYNPRTKEAKLNADRIKHWLSNGAQASATVNNLLITKGIIEGKKQKSSTLSNKRKKKLDKKSESLPRLERGRGEESESQKVKSEKNNKDNQDGEKDKEKTDNKLVEKDTKEEKKEDNSEKVEDNAEKKEDDKSEKEDKNS
ncbi:MAG: 30S ribosomal protein S16 [Candidatus Falkowbacteria bacterium]